MHTSFALEDSLYTICMGPQLTPRSLLTLATMSFHPWSCVRMYILIQWGNFKSLRACMCGGGGGVVVCVGGGKGCHMTLWCVCVCVWGGGEDKIKVVEIS